jgi:hypothetical protein
MTARSRGVGARSEASAGGRRLVALPMGLALLAVALLGGVASVAIHEGNRTVQSDAQARVQFNRDAAVRVDVLKVDMSFTAGLPHQRTHTAIVHGIASMAFELDIPCIIEGVETHTQLDAIRGMSVQAQGWYWGKPQGPGHIPTLNTQLRIRR